MQMKQDKEWCMSSYLMFRNIVRKDRSFSNLKQPIFANDIKNRRPITNGYDLLNFFEERMREITKDGKAALALSGGIDSAILAKFMPKGSTVYTFKCVVQGEKVIDETERAQKYADICGLKQKVVEVYWEDFESETPRLMERKGAPIHSIEVQIYKAACEAKKAGFDKLIFGENADIIYGGMDGLLSKDWLIGEFVDRYSYVLPYKVMKNFKMVMEPFREFEEKGRIDAHKFINKYFRLEALGTYNNACDAAGVSFVGPFSETIMANDLDYNRIRSGDSKYIVREAFSILYPELSQPTKIPMPRPMEQWLKYWNGPVRPEFYPNCAQNMTGDQKWMLYALEMFLNLLDKENKIHRQCVGL